MSTSEHRRTATAAVVRIKRLNDSDRIVEGIASSARVDRQGDIVEPRGLTYSLPIPFLMDHDHKRAIGWIEELTPTDRGVRFEAKIAKIDEPGPSKTLTDDAWQAVKSGLRMSVSIGFQGLDCEPLSTGGRRWLKWELLEISLVSVPANADAKIDRGLRQDDVEADGAIRLQKSKTAPVFYGDRLRQDDPAAEKAMAIGLVDCRLKEIDRIIPLTIETCRAAQGAHDFEGLAAAESVLKKLTAERGQLLNRKMQIDAGIPAEPAPRDAASKSPRAWEYKTIPEPTYPNGARAADDGDKLAGAFREFLDHASNEAMALGEELGLDPDHPMEAELAMMLHGNLLGSRRWLARRCAEAETRLAAIEAGGIKYAGTWQRAVPYAKGAVVTESGSAWVALRGVNEGEKPGTSDGWQLMVKAGKDAR